jgi:hypothetical protein
VSTREIKQLAASGDLQPQDLLWPDNADHTRAVVACTAIPFPAGFENNTRNEKPLPPTPRPEQVASVAVLPPAKAAEVPEALPLAQPVPLVPAVPVPCADPVPEEAGFDAQTGRIVDPVRFAGWQREQARKRREELAAHATKPLVEVYLQAKKDVERWVDREQNRDLVVAGNLEVIRRDGQLLEVLQPYQCWGGGLMDKLWQHLAFVIENRRRFYAAGL